MKRFFALAGLAALILLAHWPAQAQDDQYFRIYSVIQEGDGLRNTQQAAPALAKYLEAQTALLSFQRLYPDWNNNVVAYRLSYLATRIKEISATTPLPVARTNAPAPATAATSSDIENQLNSLRQQVGQLQNDKTLLEAKLKEALAAQPAAVDPRELARAQDQLKSLQKENDLLKVNLDRQQAAAADTKALEQLKQQLADANRSLTEQTDRANALTQEKKALQTRLDSLIPAAWNTTNIDAAKTALLEANRRASEQDELAARLSVEKTALQERVKVLMADAEAAAALRAENEILKKQLAEAKAAPASKADDAAQQLAEAKAQIAALQSDKEVLRQEKIALENRVKQLSMPVVATTTLPAPGPSADAERLKQLERERDDLQKKLEAAQKELYGRNSKEAAAKVEDLTGQLDMLRTRLGVFEAQKVPYTAEELALLKKPEAAPADPRAGRKSIKELPAGSATLVAEAQRDFAARRFDLAEQKYLQILRQDENNVYTLANLAAIQLELNHLDDADKHIRTAIASSPADAYSLSILGYLRFRQQRYNEALDALSRAAKLDPANAEIQNYLGLTLTQKGLRSAAETAFRKAIVLDPNYASANYNLAVFYLTQRTPEVSLARWHYQKALASGLPRNAELEKMFDLNRPPDNVQ